MNQAEMRFGDLLVPWVLVIGTIGFLLACLVAAILEYTALSRYVWHPPLFFIALVVLSTSTAFANGGQAGNGRPLLGRKQLLAFPTQSDQT